MPKESNTKESNTTESNATEQKQSISEQDANAQQGKVSQQEQSSPSDQQSPEPRQPVSHQQVQSSQDQHILAARHKRRIWVFALSGIGAAIVLGYLLWLFLAKGYQIMVNPQPARASSQVELVSGAGFVLSNKVYTFSVNTIVAVSATKFVTQEVVINPDSPAIIDVTLLPSPVKLTMDVTPAVEAQWQVNGTLAGAGAKFETDVQPGDINVAVSHPWYQTQEWQVQAGAAEELSETFTLVPISGELTISSQPSGADVFINNESVGTTPLVIKGRGGEYSIELKTSGYQTISDVIEVKNQNKKPKRNYLLVPEQGVIQFQLQPQGGLLSINNAPVTGNQSSVDANTRHLISYEKAGFKNYSESIVLKPGETRELQIALEPEYGEVNLTSSLPADVEINGKPQGRTPLSLSLQTIEQEIHFIRSGYRTVVKTTTPKNAVRSNLFAQMLSEFDARRKEGKPLYISGLGIEMKKFQPRAFSMGSPVNEPYRRRNEHPIKVDFNRQFWVSKHEITQSQYGVFKPLSALVKQESSSEKQESTSEKQQSAASNLPVTDVSWNDAAAYCHWLSIQEGLEPFYIVENGQIMGINPAARGYRLLTEAEWEWLAKVANRRASTQYTWGSQERIPKEYGNYADETVKAAGKFTIEKYNDGFAEKAPVGSFAADRTGLYDLDGNVSEWVHDRFTLQPPDTEQRHMNYLGMARGNGHVVKGANYQSGRYRDLRVAKRDEGTEGSPTIGFRIARYD